MKNRLPISRKVNKDLSERISMTLASNSDSEAEAMRIFKSYLDGEEPASDDSVAMIAFSMIKVEIDRAMERSRRARMRARQARQAKEAKEVIEAREVKEVKEVKEGIEVIEDQNLTEEEMEAERIRVLSASRRSMAENRNELRRLLFREARREYYALEERLLVKAQADKIKYKHETLYFNPPVFSDYTSEYITRRLKELES